MAGSVGDLIFDIIAHDKASQAFSSVGSAAERTESSFSRLGKTVAGALSVGAVVGFGIASVKAFADAERSQIELQEAFRKFPALADTSYESLHALNQEMQDKVAIDADSLDAADAVLARFRLTGREIERLTPLLADYATASGKSATEAAETLGKALLGNARALKEMGIEFVPTGDHARDLAAVMDLLQEKVGGAAEAFAGTAAGKLQAFSIAVEDMQETIGEALVPALNAATNAVKEASGVLPEFVSGLQSGATASGDLVTALSSAFPVLKSLDTLDAEGGIARMFGAALMPLGLFNTALRGSSAEAAAFDTTMGGLGATFDTTTGKWKLSDAQLAVLNAHMDEFDGTAGSLQAILTKYASEVDAAGGATGGLADATADASSKQSTLARMAEKTRAALADLKAEFDAYTGKTRNLNSATADLNEEVSKLATLHEGRWPAALNASRTGLDLNTKAGRAAWEAFDNIADKAEAAATAAADQGKWTRAQNLIEGARKDLVNQAIAWGMSKTQAEAYVDKILDVPPKVTTMIQVNSNIDAFRAVYNSIVSKNITIHITQAVTTEGDWHRPRALADDFVKEFDGSTRKVLEKAAAAVPAFNLAGALLAGGFLAGLTEKADDSDKAASAWIDALKTRIDKAVDAMKTRLDEARDRLKAIKGAYWSVVDSVRGSMQDFGAITTFDVGAAQTTADAATGALASEDQAMAARDEAAGAVLLATTDEERAAAIERLAEAEKALAEATAARVAAQTAADAAAVTGANIRANMAKRLQAMKDFAAALKTLRGFGLNKTMLLELIDAGPVDGLAMAQALIDSGIGDIQALNAAQAELDQVSSQVGHIAADIANPTYAADVARTQAQITQLQADYTELARIQRVVAELHIDGKRLVETLIRYRREHGGDDGYTSVATSGVGASA